MTTDTSELESSLRASVSKMRFMVVDDFSTMRRIVGGLIRELGVEHVVEAEDGVDALKKLSQQEIDFIVSDWNMPHMTGFELLQAIRADDRTKNLPFLLVTAEARKENILDAVRAGADGYIVKPFTSNILGEKLETILKRRSQR